MTYDEAKDEVWRLLDQPPPSPVIMDWSMWLYVGVTIFTMAAMTLVLITM